MRVLLDLVPAERPAPPQQTSVQEFRARLVGELMDLLATLRGSMPGEPDYGVLDVSHIYESRHEAGKSWCSETQAALRRFVPYLQEPRVTQIVNETLDLTFHVRIQGYIDVNGLRMDVEFDAKTDQGRAWSVS